MDPNDFTYEVASDRGQVRLLLNDVDVATAVFTDAEIDAFLAMERSVVKLAAAQAIDTNADNEALASKVLRTQNLTTDGAKIAQALHARAEQLRAQYREDVEDTDGGFFEVIDFGPTRGPELTEWPRYH